MRYCQRPADDAKAGAATSTHSNPSDVKADVEVTMNRKFRELLIENGMDPAKVAAMEREEQAEVEKVLGPKPKRRQRFDPDPNAEERFVIEGASFRVL